MAYWLSLVLFIYGVFAQSAFQYEDDDYIQYRTLPKHRIIKWNITYHDRSAVAPGYWFTAPYWTHDGDKVTNQWVPYQIGPHIFDQDGVLIWSGSVEFKNLNVYDFRRIDLPDATGKLQPHLSWMRWHMPYDMQSDGMTAVYDNNYQPKKILTVPAHEVDTHEFNVKYSPNVLQIQTRGEVIKLDELGRPETEQVITNNGFTETNLMTGEKIFEWRSNNRVKLDESYITRVEDQHPHPDYMHTNSVDKNDNGDYLLSARHTSTIYLISGKDGHIIWRLGGKKNNFEKNFDFYGQHNARFISVNSTHMTISLFNNGAIDTDVREPVSSAMYVQLDLVKMKATVLQRYMRPDGGVTDRRGNMQTLSNGNALVCWSWDGYMTEVSHDGRLLMEARFASDRHDTYRAYKFPWIGRPSYPPTLMSETYGVNGSELSTVFHVSWNGATDIKFWRFYARNNSTTAKKVIGMVSKKGFETSFIARGYMDWVSVEALDANLEVLGVSPDSRTIPPEYWAAEASLPRPDNPEAPHADKVTDMQQASNQAVEFVLLFFAGFIASVAFGTVMLYRRIITRLILMSFSRLIPDGYARVWMEDPDDLESGEDEMKSWKEKE
ncbi:hypothetical protein N7462_006530 [Penicillium macrosclerotiorum]|uniref:uncharacterized protein n=1 Tax=Penicillium macrosclerotiorum TaxID=303699 RepID=UPI0025482213|nr:uncharacterized protein N7462_006530 [Penicillium macrosclerotiorum]KAJ5683365.1 hypothetical protein N7462_006530 [Penicillium macrosclerotiorum]